MDWRVTESWLSDPGANCDGRWKNSLLKEPNLSFFLQDTLKYLLDHLTSVSRHSVANGMTPDDLSLVLGPIFFCPSFFTHPDIDRCSSDPFRRHCHLLRYLLEIWSQTTTTRQPTATQVCLRALKVCCESSTSRWFNLCIGIFKYRPLKKHLISCYANGMKYRYCKYRQSRVLNDPYFEKTFGEQRSIDSIVHPWTEGC